MTASLARFTSAASVPGPDALGTGDEAVLRSLLAQAGGIPGVYAPRVEALVDKLRQRILDIVLAGEFKRGKSSVVNALLGASVLPAGVVPLTSVVTSLRYGEAPAVEVHYDNGGIAQAGLDDLPGLVTEKGNPANAKQIREVSVSYPARWLQAGIQLIDTPGIGSVHQHNTELTLRFLPQADAVIFVASVEQPMSRNELDFLGDIRQHAGKVFILLNKIDQLSDAEVTESLAFCTAAVRDALGIGVPVFAVSARAALQGLTSHDAQRVECSRFEIFETALRRFLVEDRDAVLLASIRRQLLHLLNESRLSMEVELRALSTPLELLDSHLRSFAVKKAEVQQVRAELEAILQADARNLMTKVVEPDLETFKRDLGRQLETSLDDWFVHLSPQGSIALRAGLETRTIDELHRRFELWLAQEDGAVSTALDATGARLSGRIDDSVADLLRYCAQLFSISFVPADGGRSEQARAQFRYKFWDEPPTVLLMKNAFVTALPGAVGQALILRDAKRRAAELVEMHGGRLRHHLEERIKRNAQTLRAELLLRADATIDGLQGAIENARARTAAGEAQTGPRREELQASQNRFEAVIAHLQHA